MKNLILHDKTFTVFISIFYILGVFSVFYKSEIIFSFICLILLLCLLFFVKYGSRKLIFLYLIFFFGIIRCNTAIKTDNVLNNYNCNNAKITGRIISTKDISPKTKKVKFYIKATKAIAYEKEFDNLNSKIFVNMDITDDISKKIAIGNTIELTGNLRTPSGATNPYQFNYKKYLENKNTKNILYGKTEDIKLISTPEFKTGKENKWYYILNKFEKIRTKIIKQHAKNIKSPYLEVLGGIVFGDEAINPDEDIKENFKNSGLLHLLAASGLNVALIYGLWWWIAKLIKFPYNLSVATGAIFVVFYTFMTGFPPSILRAGLMLLFVLLGKIIDRSVNSIALIFLVGFIILVFDPNMLFDVGFQLSFAVTLGLIVCCPIVIEKFNDIDKNFLEKHKNFKFKVLLYTFTPKNMISVIMVPVIAQLWVIPLQMHYFNNFAPLSVFANIAVVPFIGILSFIGFLGSVIALIPAFSSPIVYIFDMIAKPLLFILVKISAFFASFKYSLMTTMGMNVYQILFFWTLILLLMLNIKFDFKNKKYSYTFITCLIIFSLSFIKFDYFNHDLEVIMFDVGNADSFLIKTPKNKYILIDTGKKSYKGITSAESIINPYFKNKRINKLDSMIITHFDIDHCGGAIDILKLLKAKNIYIQTLKAKSEHSSDILNYLKQNKLNYKLAKNNEEIYSENDLKIVTLVPEIKNLSSQDKFDNETSIITLLKYKNKNVLFMADSGIVGFENIKKYLPEKTDILKVGHHGAENVISQDMLNKIKPDYALISTGINKFNHPHFSTINLLNENNVKIISSKNYGFTKIMFEDDIIKFKHFENKKLTDITFKKQEEIPFNKTHLVQNFIKNNI